MTERVLYLGIDAGGTATRAAVAKADGRVLASGRGGPSGSTGGASARRLLRRALESALAPLAAVIGAQPCVVHLGLRGLSIAGRSDAARATLAERLPQARIAVGNDAAVALEGALAGSEGVAVLAGTGSIAFARRADGIEARSGGFGYLVGDEGSGFWLGREAVAASLRSLDGRGAATALGELLRSTLRLDSVGDLVAWVYAARHPAPRLAELAPLVARAADEGDVVAIDLLRLAGEALAELGITAARRAFGEDSPRRLLVARCGGVWSAGPMLIEPFESALHAALPTARSVPPRLPAVGGAILLAMAADHRRPTPEIIGGLRRSG